MNPMTIYETDPMSVIAWRVERRVAMLEHKSTLRTGAKPISAGLADRSPHRIQAVDPETTRLEPRVGR